MFRKYSEKDNVQKKSYYTDRFYVTPEIPKDEIQSQEIIEDLNYITSNGVNIIESYQMREETIFYVDKNDNIKTLNLLKNRGFDVLMELSAIDRIKQENSFEIFYELLSIEKNKRIRLKCKLTNKETIESAHTVFLSAKWAEREMYDMFGIILTNHPDLKRVLMPNDWVGHPLLKTYPLQGDEFAQWYEVDQIYGKENRDIIGPEQRDPAHIDRYDTKRFGRLGKEVYYGEEYCDNETPIEYLEKRVPILNDNFDPKTSKILDEKK